MKKLVYALFVISIVTMIFTNIYATTFTNSTLIVNPYNDTSEIVDNTMDSLSVGIIVGSIVILAGVIFFYLIPKE